MISGIFENCIGAEDIEATLKYWAEFGYREVKRGYLEAEQAGLLYNHASNLTSVRLQNGNSADHGLVRVMWWEKPRNAGLRDTLPVVEGSRWFASLTQDIYAIADAFTDDKANGGDWISYLFSLIKLRISLLFISKSASAQLLKLHQLSLTNLAIALLG